MVNPEKQVSLHRELVAAARSIVTYQIGLPLGCVRLARISSWLKPFEDAELQVVEKYLEVVRRLPIGTERLTWDRTALRREDVKLEAANHEFRDSVFEVCYHILDRFAEIETKASV
jgi:hypothetical protein